MEAVITPAGRLWNGIVAPALCLDLDGTVRHPLKHHDFIEGTDDIALFPGVEERIWEYRDQGFMIFGISNQGGVAYGHKSPFDVMAELVATLALFERNPFHIAKCCFHHPQGTEFPYNKRSLCRKPDYGLLALCEVEAFEAGYLIDWDNSLFVGDRPEDQECAKNASLSFQWAWEFFGRDRNPSITKKPNIPEGWK